MSPEETAKETSVEQDLPSVETMSPEEIAKETSRLLGIIVPPNGTHKKSVDEVFGESNLSMSEVASLSPLRTYEEIAKETSRLL